VITRIVREKSNVNRDLQQRTTSRRNCLKVSRLIEFAESAKPAICSQKLTKDNCTGIVSDDALQAGPDLAPNEFRGNGRGLEQSRGEIECAAGPQAF
jgi:hypothetical protein